MRVSLWTSSPRSSSSRSLKNVSVMMFYVFVTIVCLLFPSFVDFAECAAGPGNNNGGAYYTSYSSSRTVRNSAVPRSINSATPTSTTTTTADPVLPENLQSNNINVNSVRNSTGRSGARSR